MVYRRHKGQSSVEYTVLIVILLAAFLATGNYFKRGVQGRWKETSDGLGDQYDPRTGNGTIRHTLLTETETTIDIIEVNDEMQTTREDLGTISETKTGFITTGAY